MATTIKLKSGSGAPTSGQLVSAEPALDLTNKRLYTEDSGGNVIEVGINPSSLTTASADINGGTIDGTVIGGSSAAAGSFTTISASGEIAANGGIALGDNDKATFGASDDLQIYHDGSNSYISDTGTGRLNIQSGSSIVIEGANGDNFFSATENADAAIYYDNSIKLATTATGIDVTGTVTADGLNVGNDGQIYFASLAARIQGTSSGADNINVYTNNVLVTKFAAGGDISFYEDTGTTAKFFWDASAESLGIGTTSPARELQVEGNAHFGTASAGVTLGENSGVASVYGLNASGTTYKPVEIRTGSSGSGFYQNTSGNVGIGTTSPTEKLTLNASADYKLSLKHPSDGSYAALGAINNNFLVYNNGSERMRIDSSGNVGIGVTPATDWNTAYDALQIGQGAAIMSASGTEELFLNMNAKWASDSSWEYIATGTAASIRMDQTAPFTFRYAASGSSDADITWSEAMRIDSSGNLLVGTTLTNPTTGSDEGIALGATGIMLASNANDAALVVNRVSSNGDVVIYKRQGVQVGSVSVSGTNATYNITSDRRLKDNIVDAPSASDDIDAIQVRSFDWKADGSHQKYGMVAQELMTVAPEAVSGDPDSDEIMGVDYSKLVPMMMKEIQSLRARVAQLEGVN